ncbi:MAG: hypothetical protein CL886_08545 [Dehalococcoidia bacterium]|nr:hypothetical protein [Dehalococcoidia bacterium]
MTDYLLVHAAGQGAWTWSRVWGEMTSPDEHPPRLYAYRSVGKVVPIDLPGHGLDADGDTSTVQFDECVQSLSRSIAKEGLVRPVIVAHGSSAPIVLQACATAGVEPSRIVLISGVIPKDRGTIISQFPALYRCTMRLSRFFNGLVNKDVHLKSGTISRSMCNTMNTMDIVQSIGYFGPLPMKVLTTKLSLSIMDISCPITYVVLNADKWITPNKQKTMAERIKGAEVIGLDSCHQVALHKPKELAQLLLEYA